MSRPRLILCNGIDVPETDPIRLGRYVVRLSTHGRNPNVNIRVEDVADVFQNKPCPRLADLLEIATFVFVADSATERSGQWKEGDSEEPWERDFQFVIPVRDVAFWSQTDVQELLCDTLDFLSNDKFKFDFRPAGALPKRQEYIEDGGYSDWPFYDADRVIMFSGGLDSLSGAVRTASAGEKLILVSHRPVTTQGSRRQQLFEQLKAAYPST